MLIKNSHNRTSISPKKKERKKEKKWKEITHFHWGAGTFVSQNDDKNKTFGAGKKILLFAHKRHKNRKSTSYTHTHTHNIRAARE